MRTNSRFKAISRAVFGLLTTALSLSASVTHTVGAHGEYPTLEAAITALTPFTDNVVLQVDVGFNDGYGDPGMLIDESTFGNNGYSLTVEGVVLFDFDATYYVGDIEFRVGKDNSLETIENTDAGAFSARTVYVGDAAGESEEYLIKNHLGSTAVVTNEFGLYVGPTYDYQAYGMQDKVVGTPTARVTKTFTGKELDDELGLYYFGARYYDPDLALWISPDPNRQFASPYLYTGNGFNPINSKDPNGRELYVPKTKDGGKYLAALETISGTHLRTEKTIFGIKVIGFDVVSSKFGDEQKKLGAIIKNSKSIFVKTNDDLATAWHGGASFDKYGTAQFHSTLLTEKTSFKYNTWDAKSKSLAETPQTLTGAMAHEVFGHGYDYINGIEPSTEFDAVKAENQVRGKLGEPLRH